MDQPDTADATSKTDWERVDALTDEDIDTSDIPPLTEEFFENSWWWKPKTFLSVIVEGTPDTLS